MTQTARANGHAKVEIGLDELTGVWNRAGFLAAARPLFVSCQRRDTPVALAYFDFGASASSSGELDDLVRTALVAMARQLRGAFRASDVVGRVDTLRFAVLLPDCEDTVVAAVEGLRTLSDQESSPLGLTLTVSMAHARKGATLEQLMLDVDRRAKRVRRRKPRG